MYKITLLIDVFYLLTSPYPLRTSMMASHTSGTIEEIDCFDNLNKYIRLVNESPVAKYLRVTANLIDGEIAAR